MNLQKSIQRLSWRFSEGKQFLPNSNDADALNFLIDWVNAQKKETVNDQQLFAKMYIYNFIWELEYFKDIEFAQKSLNQLCQKPITYFVDLFHTKFNLLLWERYCKEKNIPLHHPSMDSVEDSERIKEIIETNPEFVKYTLGYWEYDKIEKSLTNQLTEAVNRYKNVK